MEQKWPSKTQNKHKHNNLVDLSDTNVYIKDYRYRIYIYIIQVLFNNHMLQNIYTTIRQTEISLLNIASLYSNISLEFPRGYFITHRLYGREQKHWIHYIGLPSAKQNESKMKYHLETVKEVCFASILSKHSKAKFASTNVIIEFL
jgi:hypothetical protein